MYLKDKVNKIILPQNIVLWLSTLNLAYSADNSDGV